MTKNVHEETAFRQQPAVDAAKKFAGWPTFPQVYVRGEFIGGNDIVTEMYHEGELHELVEGIAS